MTKKISLLFPGQGSQYPGMGKALYDAYEPARKIYDLADKIIPGIVSTIFSGSEEKLKETSLTQPAIFITSCAAFDAFSSELPSLGSSIAQAAGHSLGEYSALYSAKVFDFQTGLKLVEYRGLALEEACRKIPGTMAAILGMDKDQLESLCRTIQEGGEICEMVNFNCPGQIVAAGTKSGIENLVSKVSSAAGARAVPLNVAGAFHSKLMGEGSRKMEGTLAAVSLKDASWPVIANFDARATDRASEIKKKLVSQIDHAVLWQDSINFMIGQGIETFVEVGPGKVLSGLLRKIDRKRTALNVEDPASLEKTIRELKGVEIKTI
jgi:[acyl-carrier-protein] S-malonyltransferase